MYLATIGRAILGGSARLKMQLHQLHDKEERPQSHEPLVLLGVDLFGQVKPLAEDIEFLCQRPL